MFPAELKYTTEHEWVRPGDGVVRIGITGYAQEALGDIVFVTLPALGAAVQAGEPVGDVESTKSVSDLYAPVTGRVVARNDALEGQPELVNSDPYGAGWMLEIDPAEPAALDGLLDATAYQALVTTT